MAFFRRRGRFRSTPGASGRGPRHFDWRTVDAFASSSALTWPTDRVPPVQDTLARLAAVQGLLDMFPNGNGLPVASQQTIATANQLSIQLQRYRTAAARVRHNRSAVAGFAYDLNGFMLGLLTIQPDLASALNAWTAIGANLLGALAQIEQRLQFNYSSALQHLQASAMDVVIDSSLGPLRMNGPGGLPSLGTAPAPYPPIGGSPGAAGAGNAPSSFNAGGTALGGAAAGAQAGSSFGPYGTLIGAGVGAVIAPQTTGAVGDLFARI